MRTDQMNWRTDSSIWRMDHLEELNCGQQRQFPHRSSQWTDTKWTNIQQCSVMATRRIEMNCDFLNSFSGETVGKISQGSTADETKINRSTRKRNRRHSRCGVDKRQLECNLLVHRDYGKIMTERTPKAEEDICQKSLNQSLCSSCGSTSLF